MKTTGKPFTQTPILPDGRVPEWLVRFLSNPEVKPRSAEEIRKMLSKIKGSISDTIVEDRYGEGSH